MISKSVFLQEIDTLMAAFNFAVPEKTIETYYSFLSPEFDDEGFQRAATCVVKYNKRFPTIADLLDVKQAANKPWYCRG